MPGRPRAGRLVPRVDLTVMHLYHLVRGRTFFGDRRGGFGGVWPHIPFDEAAARAAWQTLRPVFLPWWLARYPALVPWAETAFVTGEPWEDWFWQWNYAREGPTLDVLRQFLAAYEEGV